MGALQTRVGVLMSIQTIGTRYLNLNELGEHKSLSEACGEVYTCKGGHIDIGHLRTSADWTRQANKEILENLVKGKEKLNFDYENSLFELEFKYPEKWNKIESKKKDEKAKKVSTSLSQYLAFNMAIWHEIATWFGYKYTGVFSEFQSAFSWEDCFSDLLGCHIAGKALKESSEFNHAFTTALEKELIELGVQGKDVARKAGELVRNKWYNISLLDIGFADMTRRNFDIGLENGYVTPWIVKGIEECKDCEARAYPVERLDSLGNEGFSVKVKVFPRFLEKDKILRVAYEGKDKKNYVEPETHFPIIMKRIVKEAKEMYGEQVAEPD